MKKYRKDNPEKIKAYRKFRYKRDREKIIKASKEWASKNKERYMKRKAEYRKNVYEYDLMAARTRYNFRNCKKVCDKCGETKGLQFHHPEPLAYDNFMVLCKDCHRKEHNRFVEKSGQTNDNQYTKKRACSTNLTNHSQQNNRKAVDLEQHPSSMADGSTESGVNLQHREEESADTNNSQTAQKTEDKDE